MLRFLTFAHLIVLCSRVNAQAPSIDAHAQWREYGGASDSAQYSTLRQVNRSNVTKLHVAWRYSTGDNNRYSFNPLVVDRTVYLLAQNNSIVALDALTGGQLWIHRTDSKTRL